MRFRLSYSPRSICVLLYILCVAAISLTLAQHVLSLHMPFGFVSADVSTMARSFVRHGILKLGGVPINNNDPLGNSPAVYIHWPPLLPILLSWLFRLFGESEATGNTLMIVVLFATAAVLYVIARHCLPATGACLAVLFYLTLPVVIDYSPVISQQALAIFFMLLTLLAFLRATSSGSPSRPWSVVACAGGCLASKRERVASRQTALHRCCGCARRRRIDLRNSRSRRVCRHDANCGIPYGPFADVLFGSSPPPCAQCPDRLRADSSQLVQVLSGDARPGRNCGCGVASPHCR